MTPAELYQQSLNKQIDLDDPQAATLLADALETRTEYFLTFNQIDLIAAELGAPDAPKAFTDALNLLRQTDSWWAAKWDTLASGGVDVSLALTQAKLDAFAQAQPSLAGAISAIKAKGLQRPTITDADIAAAKVYRDVLIQLKARRDIINRAQERLDARESELLINGTVDVPTIEELIA